jgi:GNAT superfamily N-acetyltransferase
MNKRLFPTVMGAEKRNSLNFSTGKPKIEKNMTDLRLLFLRTLTNVRVYGTLVTAMFHRRDFMLKLATRIHELNFYALMDVYREGNQENGAALYPHADDAEQLLLAEQDFYQYLVQCFFTLDGAVYAMWEEKGKYLSALRLEPYEYGLLMSALETAPDSRRQGYACKLMQAVQDWLSQHGAIKVYSHVSRLNEGSQRAHCNCGFHKILDHAVYSDGSVLTGSDTYLFEVQ